MGRIAALLTFPLMALLADAAFGQRGDFTIRPLPAVVAPPPAAPIAAPGTPADEDLPTPRTPAAYTVPPPARVFAPATAPPAVPTYGPYSAPAPAPGGAYPAGASPAYAVPRTYSPSLAHQAAVQLTDGSRLIGKIVEPATWRLATDYGEITVALDKLMNVAIQANGTAATFSMTNGDTLRGKLTLEKIQLKAIWGEVTLEAKHVLAIANGAVPAYPAPTSGYSTPGATTTYIAPPPPTGWNPYEVHPGGVLAPTLDDPTAAPAPPSQRPWWRLW